MTGHSSGPQKEKMISKVSVGKEAKFRSPPSFDISILGENPKLGFHY